MGNQLVGTTVKIITVKSCLADFPEYKFHSSLGSTRFLKVARADSPEGPIVVKVFGINDSTLPMQNYKEHLEDVRKKLASAVNCIPFQKILLVYNKEADKAFLMREYVKYSLYDRISTRPFLTNIEKRWITFQILYALHQCHKVGVVHGDIKLENITVTSWNWVLLVDFASFKPTFLPFDSPAEYSYFFDTSRRRVCYIAPERFNMKIDNTAPAPVVPDTALEYDDLTPAMDIFSAGCALLELWNELHAPFDYSQLLAYRMGKYSPQNEIDKLEDPSLRSLISSMIDIDPSKRLSAEKYLAQERGKLFPEYFFSFLQSYMLIFSTNPTQTPDEKIIRLKNDIGNIFKFLGPVKFDESDSDKSDSENIGKGECEGLVFITSLVTSCIRGLQSCVSKLYSLEILLELANHANDETILDRILPYIMYLAQYDSTARVKVCAIDTMTKCLNLVRKIPQSDSNVFPEYVLPGLAPLATDPNTCVRVAYAKNIATLAEIALRYLDQTQTDWYERIREKKEVTFFNYALELQALHEMIQLTVSSLLTDTQPTVKQTLMESGIAKLCVFFGKNKANDVILSHLITVLNDKEDKDLRCSFFDCIVGVAAYIGWHCSEILKPLLLQGVTDSCEFVTAKSINAMSALTELGLMNKSDLCDLVSECACFLLHPNLWVRQAVAGFVSTAAIILSDLDVQCKIMPLLKPYLRDSLIQINKPELLLTVAEKPIPRRVYDAVVASPDIDMLMDAFMDRQISREMAAKGKLEITKESSEISHSLLIEFRRLDAYGIKPEMEVHLLRMSHHLKKIKTHKPHMDAEKRDIDGRLEFDSVNSTVRGHVFNLDESHKVDFTPNRSLHRTNTSGSIETNINSDWNYSSDGLNRQSESTNSGGPPSRSTTSRPSTPPSDIHSQFISSDTTSNMSLHERSYIQYRKSACSIELANLKRKQQELYMEARRNKDYVDYTTWQLQLPLPGWRLRGVLVAHLHEHRAAVNRLCTIGESPMFASCSQDSTIRLWDCSRIEGKNIANRSKQHYKSSNNVLGITSCDGGNSLCAIESDGSVKILRLDRASNKMNIIQTRKLNEDEDGFAVDVACLNPGSQSVVVYATLYGSLVGWDLRAPGTAWRLENDIRNGYITTMCVDRQQNWLGLGTSNGMIVLWDLRFKLPLTSIVHKDKEPAARIRKVICHPTHNQWIISSIQGTNEMTMWDLESGGRTTVLWGSLAPPLSKPQPNGDSITAAVSGCIDRSPFVLTGSTDQRIRFWNLDGPTESYLAIPAGADTAATSSVRYSKRSIDGVQVVYEELVEKDVSKAEKAEKANEEVPRAGPEPPAAGHLSSISDMVLCKASQCFLVSASMGGVIKVWK